MVSKSGFYVTDKEVVKFINGITFPERVTAF